MAYDVNTDYRALQNQLKKQMQATTNAEELAQLQAQYDAADLSRTEKLASNLSQYGKWASDSELDSAAGIMAENQIGTGFETQKQSLSQSYDQAKTNAQNSALSRGMARSSYVDDRLSGLEGKKADALSQIDAAKAKAIQNAKANIIDRYQTNVDNKLAAEKAEFAQNIGAYYQDFQAEINRIQQQADRSEDWKIPYLNAARNQKIQGITERNMQYGDFAGADGLGLSPEAKANAQKMWEYANRNALMPTYGYGGGYRVARQSTPLEGQNVDPPAFVATGDPAIRNEVFGMMAGGATGKQILAAAAKDYGKGTQRYKEYEHAVNVAGAGARRR